MADRLIPEMFSIKGRISWTGGHSDSIIAPGCDDPKIASLSTDAGGRQHKGKGEGGGQFTKGGGGSGGIVGYKFTSRKNGKTWTIQGVRDDGKYQITAEDGSTQFLTGYDLARAAGLTEKEFTQLASTTDVASPTPVTSAPREKSTPTARPRKLTEDEKDALEAYGDEGYDAVNNHLRFPSPDSGNEKIYTNGGRALSVTEAIRLLDSAMSATPTTAPMSVLRGMSVSPDTNVREMFQVGGTFTDKGFVSTSAGASADKFTKPKGSNTQGLLMHIDVPEGTPSHNFGGGSYEQELLLHRNSRFKVKSVSRDDKGVWHVHLDHVGKGDE